MEELALTHITVVLFLAFMGGLLFQRLNLPAMVGYILAGAIIGPGLLGLQGNTHEIQLLAELGVIFLMFLIGIELDIQRLSKSIRIALPVALMQVALGLTVMMGASVFFGWPLALGILLGFVVSLSSTAVAIGMLKDLGAQNTETARITTGILIAQDIFLIPMLLIVGSFGSGGFEVSDLIRVTIALIVIAISLWGILHLRSAPHTMKKIEKILTAGHRQPVIAGMALCFAGATLTGVLGLSTAFGAFAMGLFLGNVGEVGASYRSATQSIHDFLLMVFFLSIGLLVDISFMLAHWFELLLLLGATIILKTIVNYGFLRLLGVPSYRAYTSGAVLAQIGEFSFVLIALGLSSGFIDNDGYQTALAVIALSLIVSPLWLQLVRQALLKRGIYLAGTHPTIKS